ncbi:MAG: hypothetical protein ACT4O1_13005 [Gemmatimonadota bacterium]
MFNKNSLKLGLTGAVLVIIMGSFTACSDGGPTAPEPQYSSGENCTYIGGSIVCPNT